MFMVLSTIFMPLDSVVIILSYLLVALGLLTTSFDLYVRYLRDHPQYLIDVNKINNPLDLCQYDVVEVLLKWRHQPQIRNLFINLSEVPVVGLIFAREGISREIMSSLLPETDCETEIAGIFEELKTAKESVTPITFLRIISRLEGFNQLLLSANSSIEEFGEITEIYLHQETVAMQERQDHYSSQFPKTGGIAKEWTTSYTNILDQFSEQLDFRMVRRSRFMPIFGRIKYVEQILTALEKATGNHIALVGEEGSGRTEIFYTLASKILSYDSKTSFDGFQIRFLDSQRLLSAARTNDEVLGIMDRVINESLKAGNVILFIDQLERLINPDQADGKINIESVLSRYLTRPELRIITTTLPDQYIELVKNNQLLGDQFTEIEIEPPKDDDLNKILLTDIGVIENRYKVFVLYRAIKAATKLATRYIKDSASPARELTILESAAAMAHRQKISLIDEKLVEQAIEEKSHVPIKVDGQERQTLLNLEQELHKRIVGQDEALKQLSDALLRSRSGISGGDRPVATFMFLGPTGVGKTETAKALAEIYFGSEQSLLRLDMAEYSDENGLVKLLGQDKTKSPGVLYNAIQKNPSSVLLLDEIEKSSRDVQNALLSLIDEGRLTTNFGKVLDFTNSIIIASSNAGAEYIVDQLNKKVTFAEVSKNLVNQLMAQNIYLPEFLNRFDGIIVYTPLTLPQMRQVVQIQVDRLSDKLQSEKKIALSVSPELLDQLAQKGYDPIFGARALERILRSDLETAIAREIIAQQPVAGAKITISAL